MVTMCVECRHSREADKHGRCEVCGSSALYLVAIPVPVVLLEQVKIAPNAV